MKNRIDEDDEPPPHDGIALSLWFNQVTELCRQAREQERANGAESPVKTSRQTPPAWSMSHTPDTPREPPERLPRVRKPHICKHPDGLITQSWTELDIRTRRLTRDHVEAIVNNDSPREFRSIAQAFKALKLPKKLLAELRIDIKKEYERFINGESESEFVAISHNNDTFIFRIIKKTK